LPFRALFLPFRASLPSAVCEKQALPFSMRAQRCTNSSVQYSGIQPQKVLFAISFSYFYLPYTQSSILRNTETASTHQSVSYLNAFPRCDPPMPWCPCCRFQGESPEIIVFPGSEPF
jgi:hypothetical protein